MDKTRASPWPHIIIFIAIILYPPILVFQFASILHGRRSGLMSRHDQMRHRPIIFIIIMNVATTSPCPYTSIDIDGKAHVDAGGHGRNANIRM
jgi:hypothetical protein